MRLSCHCDSFFIEERTRQLEARNAELREEVREMRSPMAVEEMPKKRTSKRSHRSKGG